MPIQGRHGLGVWDRNVVNLGCNDGCTIKKKEYNYKYNKIH